MRCAVIADAARAYSYYFALLGLFLGSIGQENSPLGGLLSLDGLDYHSFSQRLEICHRGLLTVTPGIKSWPGKFRLTD